MYCPPITTVKKYFYYWEADAAYSTTLPENRTYQRRRKNALIRIQNITTIDHLRSKRSRLKIAAFSSSQTQLSPEGALEIPLGPSVFCPLPEGSLSESPISSLS